MALLYGNTDAQYTFLTRDLKRLVISKHSEVCS